jgi:hypothetical protein
MWENAREDGDHGIEVVIGDGADIIDTRADGMPSVHFSREEFDAFIGGVKDGEFDLDQLDGDGEDGVEE